MQSTCMNAGALSRTCWITNMFCSDGTDYSKRRRHRLKDLGCINGHYRFSMVNARWISVLIFTWISCNSIVTSVGEGNCTVPSYVFPVNATTDECRPGSVVGFTSSCTFICDQTGYDLQGNDTATCLNTGSFSADIPTCVDIEDPVIFCPGNLTTSSSPGQSYTDVDIDDPLVTDNSGDVSLTLPESYRVSIGTSAVRFEAVDSGGNSAACSVYVTVQDEEAPNITCPVNVNVTTLPGEFYAPVEWGELDVADNSGDVLVDSITYPSGTNFPIGTTTVEVAVIDYSFNSANCSFEVLVRDVEPPTLTCADPMVTTTDPGMPTATVLIDPPVVEDNSDPVVNGSSVYQVVVPIGTYEIVFSATDASGNAGVCSVRVTVTDDEAPVLTCPADISVTAPSGQNSTAVSWPAPDVTDNSPGGIADDPVSDPAVGSIFDIGSTAVNITAADSSGNVGYCLFLVTVSDLNECEDNVNNCSSNANCTNAIGSYSCRCNVGYEGDGFTCIDIDECETATDDCDINAECNNTEGGFTCQCRTGYAGDGHTCTDVDECSSDTSDCHVQAECDNSVGSFTCTCRTGYTGDGFNCTNIDECETDDHDCDDNADCIDTAGSYICQCRAGFAGEGTTCEDIDECSSGASTCHEAAECTNTVGSFQCTCGTGYSGDGFNCTNIDECSSGDHGCDVNALCIDVEGAFICECIAGYAGDGESCTDVDECIASETRPCDVDAVCTNTAGSYTCQCQDGFLGNGTTCAAFNLCETLDPCPSIADCINELDMYTCLCNSGFLTEVDGDSTVCVDVDECSASPSPCDVNAICINSAGSYECACAEGYTGNGAVCQAIPPCESSPCQNGGTCTETADGYACECPVTHTDINCNTLIIINEPPEVVSNPMSQEAAQSARVTFSCAFQNVDGFDWTFNDRVLVDEVNRSPLVINPVQPADQGYYACVGYGSDGTVLRTESAVLTVRGVMNYLVSASFSLTYNDNLADPDSAYFVSTASTIEDYINVGLQNQPDFSSPPTSRVDRLSSGSVVADLTVFVNETENGGDANILASLSDALVARANASGGFMDPESVVVLSTQTCPELEWDSVLYGMVTFPPGPVDSQAFSTGECPSYVINAGQPVGTAMCVGDGVMASNWNPQDNCGRNLTTDEKLVKLEKTMVTMDNALDVAEQTSELTSNTESLTSEGVASASRLLEDIANTMSPEPEVCGFVVETVQNILSASSEELADAQTDNGATSRAVQALEEQLQIVDIAANNGTYRQVETNMAVQVVELSADTFRKGIAAALSTSASISDDSFTLVRGQDELDQQEEVEPEALIVIPAVVGDLIAAGDDVRCSFTTFTDPGLFQSANLPVVTGNETGGYRAANTPVISATVGDTVITDLVDPVIVSFTPLIQNATNATCVYWNFTANNNTGDWETDGCRLSNATTDSRLVCECDHLTNFAVLMDIYGGSTLSDREDFILEVLSYVGCSMSVFGLLITILTYLSNRKLRSKNPNQILLGLCVSLLGLYVTFLVMIAVDTERGEVEVGLVPCSVIAALLHFFTLSSLAWMCVEGVNMYYKLIRVVDSYISKFILKSSLCAWGIPAIVVIVSASITRENYAQTDFCFVSLWPQVGGLLVPIGIILIFNMIVFALVMRQLSRTVRGKQMTDQTVRRQRLRRLQNAVCFSILMGLTWVIGYLSLIQATSVIVQGLFTVLNSLQGYFIFMLYCVRQPQIRRQWRAQFSCCLPEKYRTTLTSSSSRFSSSVQTRSTTWKPNNSSKNGINAISNNKFNPKSVPVPQSRINTNNQI